MEVSAYPWTSALLWRRYPETTLGHLESSRDADSAIKSQNTSVRNVLTGLHDVTAKLSQVWSQYKYVKRKASRLVLEKLLRYDTRILSQKNYNSLGSQEETLQLYFSLSDLIWRISQTALNS